MPITTFRLIIAVALLFSAQTLYAATDDYTNYWSFDEGGGKTIADPRGGQNGALFGSSTKLGWASGKNNTALFFDGATGIGVALPNSILTGTQGTISLWFNLEAFSDGSILFSTKSTEDNNIYTALMIDREGRPQLQFRTTNAGNDKRAQGTKILNKGEWYNLVLVATGGTYRMYVNAEEVTVAGENSGRWFPEQSSQPLVYRIATLDAAPLSGVWNGFIDEIKIYSRPLSSLEVSALYEEGNKQAPTVPLAIRPSLSLTVSEQAIPYGGSIELKWSSGNVTSCTATGAWNGTLPLTGSRVITKLATTATYGISCVGKGGEAQQGITVAVAPKEEPTVASQTVVAPAKEALPPAVMTQAERQAKIDEIVKQILALMAQLQKMIDELKSR